MSSRTEKEVTVKFRSVVKTLYESGKPTVNTVVYESLGTLSNDGENTLIKFSEPSFQNGAPSSVSIEITENSARLKKKGETSFEAVLDGTPHTSDYMTPLAPFKLNITDSKVKNGIENGNGSLFIGYTACLEGLDPQELKIRIDIKEKEEHH